MDTAGLWMLAAVAVLMVATGLPSWLALIAAAVGAAAVGVIAGEFTLPFLSVLPMRLLGLMENDLLQALPLFVFMGVLLDKLPLADLLFRTGRSLGGRAAAPLAGLGLGMLLAPMNGSVGAGAAMLSRTVGPRLDAAGVPAPRAAALVCVASTLGVVVPPSLVLILLSDAMLRAHTEAMNVARTAERIVNTQDIFRGALIPAALLFALYLAIAWWSHREDAPSQNAAPAPRERAVAAIAAAAIIVLLGCVTLGYLYAVEAAAAGGLMLFGYGLATRALTRPMLGEVLRDTLAITGALFALLLAATTFTLVLRAYGTDRWIAAALGELGDGETLRLVIVLGAILACGFVLDAFEIIFVVVPVVMPPLLMQFPDAVRAAVLTLLVLQTSFLIPPFGYAVLMVRQQRLQPVRPMAYALLPYLGAHLVVLLVVAAVPGVIWRG